jgi:hypothetical protein
MDFTVIAQVSEEQRARLASLDATVRELIEHYTALGAQIAPMVQITIQAMTNLPKVDLGGIDMKAIAAPFNIRVEDLISTELPTLPPRCPTCFR